MKCIYLRTKWHVKILGLHNIFFRFDKIFVLIGGAGCAAALIIPTRELENCHTTLRTQKLKDSYPEMLNPKQNQGVWFIENNRRALGRRRAHIV